MHPTTWCGCIHVHSAACASPVHMQTLEQGPQAAPCKVSCNDMSHRTMMHRETAAAAAAAAAVRWIKLEQQCPAVIKLNVVKKMFNFNHRI